MTDTLRAAASAARRGAHPPRGLSRYLLARSAPALLLGVSLLMSLGGSRHS